MKYRRASWVLRNDGRPPHGGRGLKLFLVLLSGIRRGRPPHGGRGLKYRQKSDSCVGQQSPPAWGAWIEIVPERHTDHGVAVAPRMGGVD